MQKFFSCILISVVFASIASSAQQPDSVTIRKAIDEANAQYIDMFKKADAKGFALLFTEDAVAMEPGRPAITGRKEIEQWLVEETKDNPLKEGTINTLDIYILADAVYETGTFKFVSQAGDKDPYVALGKYLVIWKRGKDGSWKIFREVNIAND